MIRDHSITAEEFFQTQGIASQIRNHLPRFTHYVRTHRPFAQRMIQLALNISYAELESNPIKTASHTIN
jgi:hypothetical protein